MTATDAPSLFEQALKSYNEGAPLSEVIASFQEITQQDPRLSAGWTCLAWLQLLDNQAQTALRSARMAVKLNPQDPQARINLSLAMLENNVKGVREQIELVQRVRLMAPEIGEELDNSIADGLARRPDWQALQKVKAWLHG
jgi:cytochrome c-type biogenesis protein CcmH/NrfG